MSIANNIDLNLLRVLDALFQERSVTKAGARLSITQSAVSHALNKMRAAFDDQLFIRGPDGMHPTPRAVELSRALAPALRQIDSVLGDAKFDPATAETELVICTSDYIFGTLFPSLMRIVEQTAPGVRLWLRPINDVNIVEELDRGTVHLALGVFGRVPSRFVKTNLMTDRSVWIMRPDHPAAKLGVTLDVLGKYPHVDILISRRDAVTVDGVVDQGGLERAWITSNPRYVEGLLSEKGLSRRVGATVSHILAVPPLLATTDMIAYVPSRFARFADRTFGIVAREAPYSAPPLTISMLWHRTMGKHPSIAWMAGLLQASAGLDNGFL
ncbi:MAG: bacterial regulatory helix-turn-helix, lysR family protein [Rhizobium sp.]|nr:bacterial regulatory helix-turn-helix, lysR family protein [Rhizobium sp.]